MMGWDDLSISRVRTIIKIVVVGQLVLLIGLAADLTTIVTSAWFRKLRSWDIFKWSSYILNIVLTVVLIYVFYKILMQQGAFRDVLTIEHEKLSRLQTHDTRLWKRFIRTWRSLALEDVPNPSKRDALEPLLDELAQRLPNNGVHYKLAIAVPREDGTFKILAERGMDPSSVHTIEQKANWKEKRSFFANALELTDPRYAIYETGSTNYLDIQRPEGDGRRQTAAGSHFIVAIKNANHYSRLPKQTLALVSVGVPKGQEIDQNDAEAFY